MYPTPRRTCCGGGRGRQTKTKKPTVQPSVDSGSQDKKALAYPTPMASKVVVPTLATPVSVVSVVSPVPIVTTTPVSSAPVASKSNPTPLRKHHNRSRVIVVARPKRR